MSIHDAELFEANMTEEEFVEAVHDFYRFHDPLKPQKQIDGVIEYTSRHGIKSLNRRLRAKYGEDLLRRAVNDSNTAGDSDTAGFQGSFGPRALTKLTSPAIADYVYNQAKPLNRAETGRLIEQVNNSISTEEVKKNLVKFFKHVSPERFNSEEKDEDAPFIEEVLNWTFRIGMPALIQNLKDKFLNVPIPEAEKRVSVFPGRNNVRGSSRPDKEKDLQLRRLVMEFCKHHNPQRLRQIGIEDLMQYARKKGVAALNRRLRERYADDLDSFTTDQQESSEYKGKLYERLFVFYSIYDQQKISEGLMIIVK